jgi:hypothetical protein
VTPCAPARDGRPSGNLTAPSRAQFFCARPPALESSQPSECRRVWILSSRHTLLERASRLPRKKINEISGPLRLRLRNSITNLRSTCKNCAWLRERAIFGDVISTPRYYFDTVIVTLSAVLLRR